MPGFGDADTPRSFAYTVAGYARHLGAILEQLGVQRAHLVLHDFGGSWGLAWALAHPRALPSARVEVLEGRGHWPFWEDPDAVAALVVPFLEQQVGGASR